MYDSSMRNSSISPLANHHAIVIVGASHSGIACAEKLRQLGFAGKITLIDKSEGLPVERPPLSKHFLTDGDSEANPPLLRDKAWFADKNITLLHGQEVVTAEINKTGETGGMVVLADGSTHPWQRLVLAVGASPRKLQLPAAGGAVGDEDMLVLRSLDDARVLRGALAKNQRIAIIGGGYIGLEVAASARALKKQVAVIEAQPRLLARVASTAASEFFTRLHTHNGTDIHTHASIKTLTKNKSQYTLTLAYGDARQTADISADMIVVGIGVVPNTHLAEMLGLRHGDGIMTDGCYRTSQPGIFAIGDVALPSTGYTQGRLRLESIHHAQMSGEIAAAALLADSHATPTPTPEVPWFWSNQYDVKMQSVGLVPTPAQTEAHGFGRNRDTSLRSVANNIADIRLQSVGLVPVHGKADIRVITRHGKRHQGEGVGDTKQISFWVFADGRLQAVEAINDGQAYMAGRVLLAKSPSGITPEDIADTSRDLKSFLA